MHALDQIVVTDIFNVMMVSSPKGRWEEMHNRICYGLSLCIEGQITYIQNGAQYVSDPDHAVILPKGQSYTIRGDKNGIFPVVNFDCLPVLCDTVTVLPIRALGSLLHDYEQIKSLFLFQRSRAKIMSIFYNMLDSISTAHDPDVNLLPAIQYLEQHSNASDLTVAMLAQKCKISEVYFRKLFIKSYGITPKQFIIDMRINRAKQLLTDGLLKISAVSEQCGFSNPYHFCRVFKQKTGTTPTEYMKQNKLYKI